MYIIYDGKLCVKLLLTTDFTDFHRFSQIHSTSSGQVFADSIDFAGTEDRKGMRDEGGEGAMGNLEYRILDDEGDLR